MLEVTDLDTVSTSDLVQELFKRNASVVIVRRPWKVDCPVLDIKADRTGDAIREALGVLDHFITPSNGEPSGPA